MCKGLVGFFLGSRRGETNQDDVFGEEGRVTGHSRGEVDHCFRITSDETGEIVTEVSFDRAVNVLCALELGLPVTETLRVATEVEAGYGTFQVRVKDFQGGCGTQVRSRIRNVIWEKLMKVSVRVITCTEFG